MIDDGSTDGTSEVARAAGVRVARLERNCGHGVALRVGYQLAREHGARFIVTLDGDGQWNPAELERVLEPLVQRRGRHGDRLARARAARRPTTSSARPACTSSRRSCGCSRASSVTDTSSGFRAMRAEVTATVRQEQVQYQTSELLIGAIFQGYRIAERPDRDAPARGGESKKGHNVLYGARYAA